ncbi:hypothetical protein JNW88_26020 [Micromonospora sp. ATA32]|nr:hypothetical protein [Micromonospora sp. ATA32]
MRALGDATTDRVLAALLAMQRQSWEQGVGLRRGAAARRRRRGRGRGGA